MFRMKRITALFCAVMLNTALLAGCGVEPISTESRSDESVTGTTTLTADRTDQTGTGTSDTTAGQTVPGSSTASATGSDAAPGSTAGSTAASAPGSTATKQSTVTTAARSTGTTASGTKASRSTSAQSSTGTTSTEPVYIPKDLQELIDSMSLQQKAAQMMLVGIVDEPTARQAAADGVGALCLFAAPFKGKTKAQVRTMNASFQSKASIPLIISADEEGGSINRVSINSKLRSVPFWLGRDLYAQGGWDLVISDTKEKAGLLLDLGVNVNLAPVADVPLSSSNYIYNRCFSLKAEETAEYISKVVTEMKQDGLGSTLKHFPGYGGSVDTHKSMGYDNRDYSAFENGDLLPFIAGIEAGADAVMVSHNIVKCMDAENPASLSKNVHDLLRKTLGFQGVIISDDLGMGAIKQFTGGANPAVAAVLAGNDLVAYADYKTSVSAIVTAVQSGKISESQINASVMRILKWKQDLGLI
jgi:beta-N-acetylhexosaminidase